MKEARKIELIEAAIRLFANKGFHFTSVQDIVDECDISKGAFYHYFTSKEALHVAIFQYYFEQVNLRLQEIDDSSADAKEKIIRQIKAPFEHTAEQREFFVVYLREQSFTINKELQQFIEKINTETIRRYAKFLKEIYGEKITRFLSDLILLIDGLTTAYLISTLFHEVKIDLEQLPIYILNRVDDAVKAFSTEESPVILNNVSLDSFKAGMFDAMDGEEKTLTLLLEMEEQLNVIEIDELMKTELLSVLDYLKLELEKEEWNKLIFQGLLANLKAFPEFDPYREKIARLLNIQLL